MAGFDFGRRLRRLRDRANLTQGELGERIGVTATAISHWERGRSQPQPSDIPEIARVLGVGVAEFFDVAEPPPHRPHVEQLVSTFRQAVERNPERIEINVYAGSGARTEPPAPGQAPDEPVEPPPNVTPTGLKLIQRWRSMSEDEQREWLEFADEVRTGRTRRE